MMKNATQMMVERTGTGFSAYALGDIGIATTGSNMVELMNNVKEALELYYEDEKIIPKFSFEIDFKQFFEYYSIINMKLFAEKIGMNYTLLNQYIQGHKKPSEKQVNRIIEGLNQLGKELSELSLAYA